VRGGRLLTAYTLGMAIARDTYEKVIKSLKIGNSVAEFDSLLEAARIETPIFDDVMRGKYDMIFGRKGAGKTAIFKIINILADYKLATDNTVILSGVNSDGESLFNEYRAEFEKFTERNFETFWKFYFLSLIYNEFLKHPRFSSGLRECGDEISKFFSECQKAGIPNFRDAQDKRQIVKWLVAIFTQKIKAAKVDVAFDTSKPSLFVMSPSIEFENTEERANEKDSVYVNDIATAFKKILEKSGFCVWIILDRLDEVFDRYSAVEFNGLRGLLRAYNSFGVGRPEDIFRIKLFLRDDIVEFLTSDKAYKRFFPRKQIPPLPAATHMFAKQSPTLNWTKEEIQQLILKRLLVSRELRMHVNLPVNISTDQSEIADVLRSNKKRAELWNAIFPDRISTSNSLQWIFTRLKDSNDIVTPRTVIDMLQGAIDYQKKKISLNYEDSDNVFPIDAIKEGLRIASFNKLEKDIYNEFPKEQENIKKLSTNGEIKLTKADMQRLYGKHWETVASNLNHIGIIRYVKDSGTYRVEFLYRPALDLAYSY